MVAWSLSLKSQQEWFAYYVRRASLVWGWLGLMSLVSMVVLGLAYLVWMPTLQHQSQMLMTEIQAQQRILASAQSNEKASEQLQTRVAPPEAVLPTSASAEASLKSLLQLAQTHRLTLVTGQYQWKHDASAKGALAVYRLNMPLEGAYLDFRQFLQAAYRTLPHLALAELTIQREQRDQKHLVIQTVWQFYFDDTPRASLLSMPVADVAHPQQEASVQ